eukprot:COSAG02_NODE_3231_length_7137_cov_32.345411_7_plen_70_part_00
MQTAQTFNINVPRRLPLPVLLLPPSRPSLVGQSYRSTTVPVQAAGGGVGGSWPLARESERGQLPKGEAA